MLLHFRKKCINTDSKASLETIKLKKDANEKKNQCPIIAEGENSMLIKLSTKMI